MSELLYVASKLDLFFEKLNALEIDRKEEAELVFEQTERAIEVQERVAALLEAQLEVMHSQDGADEDDCDEEECEEDEEEVA